MVLVAWASLASSASAGTYWWEQASCYNVMQHCWATNFDPNAGSLGSNSKIDNLGQLGAFGYGGGSFNAGMADLVPASGGDYPRGGGNAVSVNDCKVNGVVQRYKPNGSACNYSPSQFVTQNYTDNNGAWHFAMGGGGNCQSYGDVACNAGQWFFPMDQASSGYPAAGVMPFTWGFGSTAVLQMSGLMYVGGVSGAFHGFACVQLENHSTTPWTTIEFCDEAFNSTGYFMPVTGVPSCLGQGGGGTFWTPANTSNSGVPMTTYGQRSSQAGVTIPFAWTVSRDQFFDALRNTEKYCPGFNIDWNFDNWRIAFTETGMETIGNNGYSAGITWQSSNISVVTNY